MPPLRTSDIGRAVAALQRGGLVAFPTETVYGLGADATDASAVARIFAVKGRPPDHPLIVHLADAAGVASWARAVPDEALVLAAACWPGPLTLVLRKAPGVLDVVTGGLDTVGLRVPDDATAHELLAGFGGGVAAPSANRFGRVSPTTADDVVAELGGLLEPRRDVVLEGAPSRVGVESTIVDCSDGPARVLRQGGVPAERLELVLGRPVEVAPDDVGPQAPGRLESHYAPGASVELLDVGDAVARAAALTATGLRVGLFAAGTTAPPGVVALDAPADPEALAHVLYARLREADRLGLDVVVAGTPARAGLGAAVHDRLARAAGPRADPRDGRGAAPR
jgi:L-threonylcarbamoyladenylate synthase